MKRFVILFALSLIVGLQVAQGDVPNLSVTFPEMPLQNIPNRALRLKSLEDAKRLDAISNLDELDQDRLYMREFRNSNTASIDPLETVIKPHAPNGKTILFFDLNFGPAEIIAARKAALARGENLLVFPERTVQQQAGIEKEYRLVVAIREQIKKCNAQRAPSCSEVFKSYDIAQKRLQGWLAQIKKLDAVALGEIMDKLAQQNVRASIIVFSGHSGGQGHVGGEFGGLSNADLETEAKKHPQVFADLSSILLWGCYSGTLHSLASVWKVSLPNVAAFIGYRNQAPLGIRESSGRFLFSYLLSEHDLLTAPTPAARYARYKALDLVANLDGTALIGDRYYAYDVSGTIDELFKICNDFDPEIMTRFICYRDGKAGCENPPPDHQGPLRQLYSFLQVNRHCVEDMREKDYNLPTPDFLIRMIYSENVKKNFSSHHASSFAAFAQLADQVDLPKDMRYENFVHSTRAEDIRRFAGPIDLLGKMRRDYTYTDSKNWQVIVRAAESLASFRELLGYVYYPMQACVPFSWVEEHATEKDSCGIAVMLDQTLSSDALERIGWHYYYARTVRHTFDFYPYLEAVLYTNPTTIEAIKADYISALTSFAEDLQKLQDRTSTEAARLQLSERRVAEAETMLPADVKTRVLADIEDNLKYLDTLLEELKNGSIDSARSFVQYRKRAFEQYAAMLRNVKATEGSTPAAPSVLE